MTKTSRPFPKSALIALLLAFFSFFMAALISRTVFERVPHLEDEMAYLYQARMYAGGKLVIPSPQPQRSYWQPFLVDQHGLRFGKYTPGWSIQLALGVLMGQTWIINALFAALSVALVYRLGREIFNSDVAVIAAALTAFSPMALLLDATLMGHTSALFAATLFLYAYWRIEKGKRRLWWGVIAGLSLGMLVINRPITGVAVAVPLILWSGIRLYRSLAYDIARLRGKIPAPVSTVDTQEARHIDASTLDTQEQMSVSSFMASDATVPISPVATVETPAAQVYSVPAPVAKPTRFAPLLNMPVRGFFPTLAPLLILSVFALLISLLIPIYNYAAVGNPTQDLYLLVWSYDTVGFGPCCGRNGHNLEKGMNQARFDLSLTASDLFGWETGSLNGPFGEMRADLKDHLLNQGDYWGLIGLSWVLLPFAFIVAYRKKTVFIVIWVAVTCGLLYFAIHWQNGIQMRNPTFSWLWLGAALAWLYLPIVFWRDQQRAWTWLLWCIPVGLVVMQMSYWIGSQRYSTRYFFEGLTAIAIISALPIAWLARRVNRPLVYALFVLALGYSLYFYSTPRIDVLTGYNFIDGSQIAGVQARRTGDKPVLVIINGANVAWRAFAALAAETSPYLNSDIVAAWNYEGVDGEVKKQILEKFPDRQVIEMQGSGNYAWFSDQQPPPEASTG